ncbi:MAG: helix-turn-helix domain-containing protein [Wenzhouxiangellaceae bacterium]
MTSALARIGKQLRAGRRARYPDDTQGDFARRLGVSRYTWQKVERGDSGVAIGTLIKAAELLGIVDKVVDAFAPPRRSLFERDQ